MSVSELQFELNRSLELGDGSACLTINEKAKALRNEGKTVYHLGFGQAPFPVPPELVESLKAHANRRQYLPVRGLFELRESICKYRRVYHKHDVSPEGIIIGPGSKLLLCLLFHTFEGPLLIPAPCWVSYAPQAKIMGKEYVPVITRFEDGYKLTPQALEQACEEHTGTQKTLILNNPGNPTGALYSPEELAALTEVFRRHNVAVIGDEIYGALTYEAEKFVSISSIYPEGSIVTSGLSKAFSAGGYRIGYAAIPRCLSPVADLLSALVSEVYSCVSTPVQHAAVEAYTNRAIYNYIRACAEIHQCTSTYLERTFESLGLRCNPGLGAFYLFPDFSPYREQLARRGIHTSAELANALLEEASIAVLPGEEFLYPADALAVRVATVDYDGGKALTEYRRGLRNTEFIDRCMPNLLGASKALGGFLDSLK